MSRRANGEGSIYPYRNGFAAHVWIVTPKGRRQRKTDAEFQPARLRMCDGAAIARAHTARQFRHQHGADGDADDAERQFYQAVGKIQPRHRRWR